MYNTEKNPGFNIKDIVIKAIFLVLFILLLVWLFPKVPNMKPFYSNVFRENIKYMQEAAESYYTTEKLPKNIGDTAEMTLQDMIDKNLILPFVDEDGNACDTKKSYVEVKKNKNDYTLKVNLVCPNEENFVEKTLGCYEYCEDCKEEEEQSEAEAKKVIEYQYKQVGTKNVNYYSCPDGGTLTDGVCNIYTTDTYKATITTTKGKEYCPDGGELKDGLCYNTKTESYDASVSEGKYYCPNGGTLNGSKCYINNSTSYPAKQTLSCTVGTLSGNSCIVFSTSSSNYPAKVSYSCPNGGTLSGSKCITQKATSGSSYAATKTTTRISSRTPLSGSDLTSAGSDTQYICTSSSNCPGYVTIYYYIKTTYSCPNGGTLNGTNCVISGTSEKSYSATPSYSCPSGGSLSGSTCIITNTTNKVYDPVTLFSCTSGGTLSGSTCIVTESSVYDASKSNGEQYCSKGGTLSNGKCIITDTTSYKASVSDGTSVKTCPDGGSLKDDGLCYVSKLSKSYKATLNTKKQTYTNYKWSTEESLEGWTRTGETRMVTVESSANKQK